ncbi:hypothetical protein E2C01_029606 [Portunus trituberculatus]|uniref:Uncharacterized protein n=1 Tax=Portunus trituberculatus TaxID=210409 RepID=A0A5B7ESB6_PORTR|nr:hypothetical protein [Portunus trituberculatus]
MLSAGRVARSAVLSVSRGDRPPEAPAAKCAQRHKTSFVDAKICGSVDTGLLHGGSAHLPPPLLHITPYTSLKIDIIDYLQHAGLPTFADMPVTLCPTATQPSLSTPSLPPCMVKHRYLCLSPLLAWARSEDASGSDACQSNKPPVVSNFIGVQYTQATNVSGHQGKLADWRLVVHEARHQSGQHRRPCLLPHRLCSLSDNFKSIDRKL